MKKPDARRREAPTSAYLYGLLERAGLSQLEAARRIGISPRGMRYYMAGERPVPYAVQYALEALAR